MSPRPTDGSDEPEATDQVMLSVLANRGRGAAALSAEQELLLDEWMAGRLAPDAAARAATLVKQNSLAAERVLERRLLEAAGQSPPVPQDLTARILKAKPAPRMPAFADWWRSRRRWQWLGVAGVAALAATMVVAGLPLLQQEIRGSAPIQVAMVAIGDRIPLFEGSDIRMRGAGPAQGAPSDQRFRDVEMPTVLLRNLMTAAAQPSQSAASREIGPYLPSFREDHSRTLHLVIDDALKQRVETDAGRERMPVRIYNLEDPRAADIRSVVGALPDGARSYLLTLKP